MNCEKRKKIGRNTKKLVSHYERYQRWDQDSGRTFFIFFHLEIEIEEDKYKAIKDLRLFKNLNSWCFVKETVL